MPFTLNQQKALAIAPMVSALLSVTGSGCIIKVVLSEKAESRTTYHRILLAMSTIDFSATVSVGFSTLPIPRGTPGIWLAKGNIATCTAQAFLSHPLTWIPALNASLAIYYLLVCRNGWTEDRIRNLEPLLIGVPVVMAYGTSAFCAATDLFNNANLWCWIASFPQGCKDSVIHGEEGNCTRGDNAFIYRYALAYVPLWISIAVATTSMLLVYLTVLKQEREVDKFQENGTIIRTQSKRIFRQCLWYMIAFYLTWTPSTIVRIMQAVPQTKGRVFYPLIFLMAVMVPLQGFLNFLVFTRSRYCKYRRENPADTNWGAMKVAAFSIASCQNSTAAQQACCPPPSSTVHGISTEAMLHSEAAQPQEKARNIM